MIAVQRRSPGTPPPVRRWNVTVSVVRLLSWPRSRPPRASGVLLARWLTPHPRRPAAQPRTARSGHRSRRRARRLSAGRAEQHHRGEWSSVQSCGPDHGGPGLGSVAAIASTRGDDVHADRRHARDRIRRQGSLRWQGTSRSRGRRSGVCQPLAVIRRVHHRAALEWPRPPPVQRDEHCAPQQAGAVAEGRPRAGLAGSQIADRRQHQLVLGAIAQAALQSGPVRSYVALTDWLRTSPASAA